MKRRGKQKVIDVRGRFEFKDVKPGRYMLISTVTWYASGNSWVPEGGEVTKEVQVLESDTTVEAMLTR